jgi:hypothetical protein
MPKSIRDLLDNASRECRTRADSFENDINGQASLGTYDAGLNKSEYFSVLYDNLSKSLGNPLSTLTVAIFFSNRERAIKKCVFHLFHVFLLCFVPLPPSEAAHGTGRPR